MYKLSLVILCTLLTSTLYAEEFDANWTSNLQTFRTLILPRNESKLDQGESRLRIQSNWANIWSLQDERFLIDGEELSLIGTWRIGLGKFHQTGIRVAFLHQSGGSMDSTIESFHQQSGVGQNQRDIYDRDRLRLSFEPYGEWYYLFDQFIGDSWLRARRRRETPRHATEAPVDLTNKIELSALLTDLIHKKLVPPLDFVPFNKSERKGITDPRWFLQSTLYQSNHWFKSLHSSIELKFPAHGGELFGSPGIDTSLSLTAEFQFTEKLIYSIGLSWTHFSMQNYYFIKLPKEQWIIRPAVRWILDEWEIFAEYIYFSKPVNNFGELSEPGHQIAIGTRINMANGVATFSFIENMINYDITPDIVFQVGYELKL